MGAKLVEIGRFSGADREAPAAIDIVDVVALSMPLAVAGDSRDREHAVWWYAVLPKRYSGSSRRGG